MSLPKASPDIFERVARREITPEQGADLLWLARQLEWENARPRWLPRWLYHTIRSLTDKDYGWRD